ncbi:cuticle protein 3-like [Diabrotica undecimpunctata]|uniref:cuticle protein 3-like n=1 Tax=Diabrotica undecimpunctata TaxID=50387 RepID=UPI003B6364EB
MKTVIVQIFTIVYLVNGINGYDIPQYHTVEQPEHQKKPVIPILKYTSERDEHGWKYSYETGNGIQAEEAGYIKNLGDEKHESVVQQGSVTYHDEHGHPVVLTYVADEHGFRAQGDHLPTPPPIPEAIQKSLEEGNHKEEAEQIQENVEDYEEKAGYGQESRTYGQAQSYVESQTHGLKQSYYPTQPKAETQYYNKGYGQATFQQKSNYKYPHSQGLNQRQRH